MGSFIAKQPNGLYCRFSTVVDCPTHWNMTEEDYIELCKKKAEVEARETLKDYLQDFNEVIERFNTTNMTEKKFKEFLECTQRDEEGEGE